MIDDPIYKLVPDALWKDAEAAGVFEGSPVDLRDGFIHFSTGSQARETAARHFAGQAPLRLVSVDPRRLGEALKWEASRGGTLFPHLYGRLPLDAVIADVDLPLGTDGLHVFPDAVR